MTKKILPVAIAIAIAMALTAGSAQASGGDRSTLVLSLAPNLSVPVACPGSLFGFALDLKSLAGRSLGSGRSCVSSIDGCDPFVAFCRRTVRATLTLDLARGSLTVPIKLIESLPTESSFIQLGSGEVRGGTGAYATARGRVTGGGAGEFDGQFIFHGRLVYAAELSGVR